MNANRGYDVGRDIERMEKQKILAYGMRMRMGSVRFCSIIVGADAITIASAAKVAVTITVDFMCKKKVKKKSLTHFTAIVSLFIAY